MKYQFYRKHKKRYGQTNFSRELKWGITHFCNCNSFWYMTKSYKKNIFQKSWTLQKHGVGPGNENVWSFKEKNLQSWKIWLEKSKLSQR